MCPSRGDLLEDMRHKQVYRGALSFQPSHGRSLRAAPSQSQFHRPHQPLHLSPVIILRASASVHSHNLILPLSPRLLPPCRFGAAVSVKVQDYIVTNPEDRELAWQEVDLGEKLAHRNLVGTMAYAASDASPPVHALVGSPSLGAIPQTPPSSSSCRAGF